MWVIRITPRVVVYGLGLHMCLRALSLWLLQAGFHQTGVFILDSLRVVGAFVAYAIALLICWWVAGEYRGVKWMRLAWLALTCNAAFSLIRPFSRPIAMLGQTVDLYSTPPQYALFLHLVLVPANFCLLLGVLAIWWACRETGLGFVLRWPDYVALAGLLALMVAFFRYSHILTEAQAYYRTTGILQLIAQVQMFLLAAASFLLHRVAIQMGSGRLGLVLRWMAAYAVMRLGMVLIVSVARKSLPNESHLITDLAEFGWQAAPWVFALAVAYRAEMTALAAKRLALVMEKRFATSAL